MITFIIIGASLVVFVVAFLWPRVVEPELKHIVAGLASTVSKLEDFVENKEVEIADHLEEIALHNEHVTLKSSERERAKRIRDKLNELLA